MFKVALKLERETKNTVVYSTDDESAPIETQYIKKSGLPTPYPLEIIVAVARTDDFSSFIDTPVPSEPKSRGEARRRSSLKGA